MRPRRWRPPGRPSTRSPATSPRSRRPARRAVADRLLIAGRDALGRGAPTTAINRLRRALAEDAGPRAELLFELGRAESFARDPAAFTHFEQALAAADGPLRLRTRVMLSELYAYAGMWEQSAAVIDGGADEPDPELELLAVKAALEANDPDRVDRFTDAWDELERATRTPTTGGAALRGLLASEAVSRGRAGEAATQIDAALSAELVPGIGGTGHWPATQLLMALIHSDDLERADAFGRTMAEAGRRRGSSTLLLLGLLVPAWTACRRGDLAEAEARTESILDIVTEAGLAMWITSAAWMLEDVLAERDGLAAFRSAVLDLELPPEFDRTSSGALLRAARAHMALAGGEDGRALAELREAEPVFRALGVGPARIAWRTRLAMAADDPRPAAEELSLARSAGYPRPIGVALRTLGVLLENTGMLRESLAVLEAAPSPLERGYTLIELGALLRREGDLAGARDVLTQAAEVAQRCGAQRLLARARRELQVAGARPRREAYSGLDALTPRELHVARLAASGLTNVAIAQQLFVSVKTVETHLTSIYAKLGLTGHGARGQLARALGEVLRD